MYRCSHLKRWTFRDYHRLEQSMLMSALLQELTLLRSEVRGMASLREMRKRDATNVTGLHQPE